jgi:hypothetical protein
LIFIHLLKQVRKQTYCLLDAISGKKVTCNSLKRTFVAADGEKSKKMGSDQCLQFPQRQKIK